LNRRHRPVIAFALCLLTHGAVAHAAKVVATKCNPPHQSARAAAVHAAFVQCIEAHGLGEAVDAYLADSGMFVMAGEGMFLGTSRGRRMSMPIAQMRTLAIETSGELASADGDSVVHWGTWSMVVDNSARRAFLLVWARDHRGMFRLASGVFSRPMPTPNSLLEPPVVVEATDAKGASIRRALAAVTLAEAQFGGLCGASGMAAAFEAQADDLLAIVRDVDGRLAGKKNVLADARVATERWRYVPLQVGVAKSNDLAFVTGRYSMWKTNGAVERGYFTRVWQARKDVDPADSNSWKVVIDAAAALSR
jgi:hypothetical protein